MVIVILSVTSMMVVPSFFSASSESLHNEARRLVQTLRLAQDEALLSGDTLRITLRSHSYAFQVINIKNEWAPFNQSPYQEYKFSEGVRIDQVDPQPPLTEQTKERENDPTVAHLLIPAEGINQVADITLIQEGDEKPIVIQFRPGPGGVRIFKEESSEAP